MADQATSKPFDMDKDNKRMKNKDTAVATQRHRQTNCCRCDISI